MITAIAVAHGLTLVCGTQSLHLEGLRNRLGEVRVQLPEGAMHCSLSRIGAFPTQLDLVAVEQDGLRLPIEVPAELRVRDLSLYELDKPLQLQLPAPAHNALFIVAGRQELVPPAGRAFVLRAGEYVPRAQGKFVIDGKLDADRGTPLLKVPTVPGSGHPAAWATAWVRDDGKKLYAALDFASDDTDDHGDDYAELWAGPKGREQRFRVTTESAQNGRVSMERTPGAPYLHKVYEFALPFAKVGAHKGKPLTLAFAAYGTATVVDVTGGGVSRDGNRFAFRAEHFDLATPSSEFEWFEYANGAWTQLADFSVDKHNGPTLSWLDSAATGFLFDPNSGNSSDATPELLGPLPDGGVQVDVLERPELHNATLYDGTLSPLGGRVMLSGFNSEGYDAGIYSVLEDGGTVKELDAQSWQYPAWFTDDSNQFSTLDNNGVLSEWTWSGSSWDGPFDAGQFPINFPFAHISQGNHAGNVQMSKDGNWLTICEDDGTVGVWQRLAAARSTLGAFQELDAGLQQFGCEAVAINADGVLAFADSTASIALLTAASGFNGVSVAGIDGGVGYLGLADDGQTLLVETSDKAIYYLGPRALTALPGVSLPNLTSFAPDAGLPMLSLFYNGNPTDLLTVTEIPIHLAGSLAPSVSRVQLIQDVDQNGAFSAGVDQIIDEIEPDDGGVADFSTFLNVPWGASPYLLALPKLRDDAGSGLLQISTSPAEQFAIGDSTGYELSPAGSPITGPTLTVAAVVVDAGTPDSGTPDAGTPDAGAPDAGAADSGTTTPDAGNGTPDAGSGSPKNSGCGCGSAGLDGWMLMGGLVALLKRRRAIAG